MALRQQLKQLVAVGGEHAERDTRAYAVRRRAHSNRRVGRCHPSNISDSVSSGGAGGAMAQEHANSWRCGQWRPAGNQRRSCCCELGSLRCILRLRLRRRRCRQGVWLPTPPRGCRLVDKGAR